jgi:hypothetical protein
MDKLDDVYSSENIFSSNETKWHVPRMGEKSNRQTALISNTEISSNLVVIFF